MKKLNSLQDIYIEMLREIYNAESQLTKALPKMAKASTNQELVNGFQNHLKQTEEHVVRIEKVFSILDVPLRGKRCIAIEGLIQEGKEIIDEEAEPEVKDAALIAAAQKVEHYEIATYGTLVCWATQLGYNDQSDILQSTLDEEKETDEFLSELAESTVNENAMS